MENLELGTKVCDPMRKVKGKTVPMFNIAPRHKGVLGEWGHSSTLS